MEVRGALSRRIVFAVVLVLLVGGVVLVAATVSGDRHDDDQRRADGSYAASLTVHDRYIISARGYVGAVSRIYLFGPRSFVAAKDIVTGPRLSLGTPPAGLDRSPDPLYELLASGTGQAEDGRICDVWVRRHRPAQPLLESYGLSAAQGEEVATGRSEVLVVSVMCEAGR